MSLSRNTLPPALEALVKSKSNSDDNEPNVMIGSEQIGPWTVGPQQCPTCQEPYWALSVFKEAPCLSCVQILVRKRDKSFNFEATLPRARMLCFIVSIVPDLVTPTSSPLFEMTIALLGIKISLSNYLTIINFGCRPIITTHTNNIFTANLNRVETWNCNIYIWLNLILTKLCVEQFYVIGLQSFSLQRYFGATAATSAAFKVVGQRGGN